MRRFFDSAASSGTSQFNGASGVAFPCKLSGRHAGLGLSELNSWPVCTPVNASPGMLPPPAHDSGPEWLAKPSLYDSFIRYSMPVYPGTFSLSRWSVAHNQ